MSAETVTAGVLARRSRGDPLDLPLARRRRPPRGPRPDARGRTERAARDELLHDGAARPREVAAARPHGLARPRRRVRHRRPAAGPLRRGVRQLNSLVWPWHQWLDEAKYARHVAAGEALRPQAVTSAHGPVLTGAAIPDAFSRVRAMASQPIVEPPGPSLLDELIAGLVAAH